MCPNLYCNVFKKSKLFQTSYFINFIDCKLVKMISFDQPWNSKMQKIVFFARFGPKIKKPAFPLQRIFFLHKFYLISRLIKIQIPKNFTQIISNFLKLFPAAMIALKTNFELNQ